MPTLHGYRERIPLNVYDAFAPREFNSDSEFRMFGNKNIGNELLTNLQCAGQMYGDAMAVIANWYARTNVDLASRNVSFQRAWDAWTHVTIATVTLGASWVTSLPLADLLQRHQGQNLEIDATDGDSDLLFAKDLAAKHSTNPPKWEDLRFGDQQNWIAVAREARRVLKFPLLMVIPERQCYSVRLRSEHSATRALLEMMPTDVAPQSLVWIHLEGEMRRYHQ